MPCINAGVCVGEIGQVWSRAAPWTLLILLARARLGGGHAGLLPRR